MSVTAQDIITRALRKIGAIDAIETPSAEDQEDALDSLNDILGEWSITRGLIIAQTPLVLQIVSSKAVYTIGPGGDLDVLRPVRIESAVFSEGGSDWRLPVEPVERLDEYSDPDCQGVPDRLFYATTSPAMTVRPYPAATGELRMLAWSECAEITDAYAELDMPRYFATYLRVCLQVDLAPDYGRPIDPAWLMRRDELRSQISAVHGRRMVASFDPAIGQRRCIGDFRNG